MGSANGTPGPRGATPSWNWETFRRPGLVGPVFGILVAESMIFLASRSGIGIVPYALWVYLLVLIACALGPVRYPADTGLFLGFILVPTFRLVNVGMPTVFPNDLVLLVVVYLPFVPATYYVGRVKEIPDPRVGIRTGLRWAPGAVLLGAILAPVEFAAFGPDAIIPATTLSWLLGLVIVMGLVSYVEEVLFRGILLETLVSHIGVNAAIAVVSVVFAAMHSTTGSAGDLAFTFGFSLVACYSYLRLESLGFVVILHWTLNVFVFGLLPFAG